MPLTVSLVKLLAFLDFKKAFSLYSSFFDYPTDEERFRNTQDGVQLEITRTASGSGTTDCYIFTVADAQMDIMGSSGAKSKNMAMFNYFCFRWNSLWQESLSAVFRIKTAIKCTVE